MMIYDIGHIKVKYQIREDEIHRARFER